MYSRQNLSETVLATVLHSSELSSCAELNECYHLEQENLHQGINQSYWTRDKIRQNPARRGSGGIWGSFARNSRNWSDSSGSWYPSVQWSFQIVCAPPVAQRLVSNNLDKGAPSELSHFYDSQTKLAKLCWASKFRQAPKHREGGLTVRSGVSLGPVATCGEMNQRTWRRPWPLQTLNQPQGDVSWPSPSYPNIHPFVEEN